eukprot:1128207-Alexandrium_andersonii.AAC.1
MVEQPGRKARERPVPSPGAACSVDVEDQAFRRDCPLPARRELHGGRWGRHLLVGRRLRGLLLLRRPSRRGCLWMVSTHSLRISLCLCRCLPYGLRRYRLRERGLRL